MSRRILIMLAVAGSAALLQAVVTLGAFAWLSRTLPVAEVGRFGLYLAIVALALALDGVRPVVVVAASRPARASDSLGQLATISWLLGLVLALCVALAGRLLLSLEWMEIVPLAATCCALLSTGPGLGRLEASGGPHFAVALHSVSWSIALILGSSLAVHQGSAMPAAWAMLVAPILLLTALSARGFLVAPSRQGNRRLARQAADGIASHMVTAISAFLDKGAMAVQAGPFALGLYTPISELTGRAAAMSGMVANLFLNAETRLSAESPAPSRSSRTHTSIVDAFFALSSLGIVVAAVAAPVLLETFVARSSPPEVLSFRLLLLCLALNIGAQWSAVTLRARNQFDLYRPYVASLLGGLLLAPWLISVAGIVGGALTVMVLRTADIALIVRAREMLSPVQRVCITATVAIVLAIALTTAMPIGRQQ